MASLGHIQNASITTLVLWVPYLVKEVSPEHRQNNTDEAYV